MDKDGNRSEETMKVYVVAPVLNTGLPYYLRVNRALNVVTVYTQDKKGEYTEPYKAFVCSCGADQGTPSGIYNTYDKYRWLTLYGPCYGQYATRFNGPILFHSVPYYTQDPSDLECDQFPLLGQAVSMGCVRLCVRDAKWIYDNCPMGTVVEIYDDYENPGPLGKPAAPAYDVGSENRGWDPTDPDPANPWLAG